MEALHNHHTHLRETLEGTPHAVVSMDSDGRVLDWNRRAETLLGLRRDEAIGWSMALLIFPLHHEGSWANGSF